MPIDTSAAARPSPSLRSDRPERPSESAGSLAWNFPQRALVLAALAAGFVLLGGGSLELGPVESRLGLASAEGLGPYGQVFGGWEPSVWVGQLVPSLVWSWGEGWMPTAGSVRWPSAMAGVAVALILARRASNAMGGRAAVLVALCWLGSVGLIDRSAGTGLDLISGLFAVAAVDRLLGRGSDLTAGLWLALAFLAGGWPPLALVVMAVVVLGRSEASLSWRLLAPPVVAASAWSAWALSVASAEAWGAAIALPLTQRPAWLLAPGVLALGLPWTPFAALVACRSVREGWPAPGRSLVTGWLQVAAVCLLAGTVVPGLADAARVPALAGLAVAAAASLERMLAGAPAVSPGARRWFFGSAAAVLTVWAVVAVVAGGYLTAVAAYYRPVMIPLILLGVPAAGLALISAARRETRGAFAAVFALAVFLKAAHFGYYVPEWNYRLSQGPWGRAIGQWVPPRWPIYTTHTWNADLAFATGRPVRQIPSPEHLAFQPGKARFVLLLESEYRNWPETAPHLIKVAAFQDEHGSGRVLARTEGKLPWTRPKRDE